MSQHSEELASLHLPPPPPAPTDALDWVLTVLHGFVFFIILLVFDLAQRIAFVIAGRPLHEIAVLGLNHSLLASLKLLGMKLDVRGYHPLEKGRPYIIVSNHQSLYDIPMLHSLFGSHRPRFIAKEELAHWIPSVSFNLRHGGNAVIDRSNAKQAVAEIEQMGRLLSEIGCAGVIFPEGTRAKDGILKRFRYAGLASLLQTAPDAAIIPVTIDGSWELVPTKSRPVPRGAHIKIVVGEEISRDRHDSLKKFINEIEHVIATNLNKLRAEGQRPVA